MEKLQAKLDNLQVDGGSLTALLKNAHFNIDRVRTAKLGALDPKDQWVAPLTATPLTVKTAKLTSLNAKRRSNAQVDRVLLELVRLEEFALSAQHSAFKHAYLKQLRAGADKDVKDDLKERQQQQDARAEEAAKRSEATAARKRRRINVEESKFDEDEPDVR